ncbi:hypothetical protein GCM10007391_32910 [Alteromonas halophila]|uniref:Uncharacterized protein n=1 Tax=Alteromonas halophila TaxID=516698 RepID=A0A918JR30_9ALTE|nr:hypothetical protein GCM10007391_32910 [Alteromonas halophila]
MRTVDGFEQRGLGIVQGLDKRAGRVPAAPDKRARFTVFNMQRFTAFRAIAHAVFQRMLIGTE